MRSAPTLNIWITPFASVAMLEKLALLKIALCRAPAVSRASCRRPSVITSTIPAASSIAPEPRLFLDMAYLRPGMRSARRTELFSRLLRRQQPVLQARFVDQLFFLQQLAEFLDHLPDGPAPRAAA